MSDIPRTDRVLNNCNGWHHLDYIKQLESNNDAANAEIERLTNKVAQLYRGAEEQNQRIKRLEEALAWYETRVSDCNRQGPEGDAARDALAKDYGRKAKEAKP